MDELARLLSVERYLLELLLFKLVERRHLLAAGETRFLSYAEAEVDRALERAQLAELRRSIFIHELGGELGVVGTILVEHRHALCELAAEIEDEGQAMPSLADFCTGRPA
ncbi:MAG TPA: hypothetical protein VJS45_04505 [Acidimicrobiia bacterium]|nr:hypothetical protein [Acidimicrobiia bacterium]